MPVHAQQIPLDTAKAWAKRLTKTSKTIHPHSPWKLSQGQAAVAQMLGFQDWHALEQGLTQAIVPVAPSVEPILPNPFLHRGAIPGDTGQWREFWRQIMDKSDQVFFEDRGRGEVRVRMRVWGKLFELLTLDRASGQAQQALESLFEGTEGNPIPGIFSTEGWGGSYVAGFLPNHSKDGHVGQYHFLPIYPGGWDFVVSIARNVHHHPRQLKDLNLPVEVLHTLRRLGRRNSGLFLFTGRMISGRSTLMKALSHQVYSDRLLTKPIENRDPLPADELPGVNGQMSGGGRTRRPMQIHWATPENLENPEKFEEFLSHRNVDVLILDNLQDANGGRFLGNALSKNMHAWVGLTSSGSPSSLMGRLKDFLPNWEEDHPHGLNGWTYGNLLRLLCPHCSLSTSRGEERDEGPGCGHCSMNGAIGRQLVLDVWEVEQGRHDLVESALKQTRALVASGKVARSDAENQLGPISE